MNFVLRPIIFVIQLLSTSFWPVVQMIWVIVLTGVTGLQWYNWALGAFIPFYGWYLIFIRWAEYSFLNQ